MRKIVLAAILSTFLTACAALPRLSYDPAEVFKLPGQIAGIAQCKTGQLVAVQFEGEGVAYQLFVVPDTKKAVLVNYDADGNAVQVAFGTIEMQEGQPPVFTPVEVLPVKDALAKYGEEVCGYMDR